jgi:copper chaperone NosL
MQGNDARSWLAHPLDDRSRWLLLLLLAPLLLAMIAPIWHMRFEAPQYPQGLELVIFPYTVSGDVQEVNTLNHYIGMSRIDRAALSDLDFLPFAIGAFALLLLRVVAFADLRSLLDLIALYTYFGLFAFARFAFTLYVFGHNLDPTAPFRIEPFTPTVLGTGSVANFTITSLPARGSFYLALVGAALIAVLFVNARRVRRQQQAAAG